MTAPQNPRRRQTGRRKNARRAPAALAALALVAAFGSLSCSKQSPEVGRRDVSTPGVKGLADAPAPLPSGVSDERLEALDGGSFKLSDYAGKVVVLNLWATWCAPCRVETPHLVELSREFGPRGAEFVGLAMDDPATDAGRVRDFAREYGVGYTVGWAGEDFARSLMRGYDAIPQSFVITRDGRVLQRFVGFDPERTPAKLREAIARALDE